MKKSVFTVLNYLLPAKRRDADALLGQCRAGRRRGDLLRPFRHRQDDAVGRSVAHADRRRRAWLGRRTASSISKAAATPRRSGFRPRPSRRSSPRRSASAPCSKTSCSTHDRVPDFDDGSLTENTRCAYPLDFIPNASKTGRAGHPKNIIMLTADAFGVMPPIARLTPAQAMYHFLSGYTAKVAGTEKGVTEPEATFSTCFGAPFMPRHPVGIRQPAARADRRARRRLLAGQHRLDRRRLRHRQAHADQGDARAAGRRARRLARQAPSSAPIRISASRCRSPCRASTATSSIRARPGPTRPPMTARPASWSACSSTTSRSSKTMSMPPCAAPRPRLQEAAE